MVRFENVGLRYGLGPEVLQDISFFLPPGSFHFLVGASGAGKSSLLRLMYMALKPSRGLITLFGRDIATTTRKDLPALRGGGAGLAVCGGKTPLLRIFLCRLHYIPVLHAGPSGGRGNVTRSFHAHVLPGTCRSDVSTCLCGDYWSLDQVEGSHAPHRHPHLSTSA